MWARDVEHQILLWEYLKDTWKWGIYFQRWAGGGSESEETGLWVLWVDRGRGRMGFTKGIRALWEEFMTEVAEKGKRLGQSPQIVIFITYSYNHEGLCDTTIIKTLIIRVLINAFMIVAIGYYVELGVLYGLSRLRAAPDYIICPSRWGSLRNRRQLFVTDQPYPKDVLFLHLKVGFALCSRKSV